MSAGLFHNTAEVCQLSDQEHVLGEKNRVICFKCQASVSVFYETVINYQYKAGGTIMRAYRDCFFGLHSAFDECRENNYLLFT